MQEADRPGAPDVRARLEQIGDFVINDHNLTAMRSRQIRDPGRRSGRVEHLDLTVPGDPQVPIRLHREQGVSEERPAVISIHGGGYVIGTHLGDDARFEQWSPKLRCVGLSVGYRLAPEWPYPDPLEDCYAALRWLHENATELAVDRGRIGVLGGSAGGGLGASLALLARDRGEFSLAFQVLSYPMLDDQLATESSQRRRAPLGSDTNQFALEHLPQRHRPQRDPTIRRSRPSNRPQRTTARIHRSRKPRSSWTRTSPMRAGSSAPGYRPTCTSSPTRHTPTTASCPIPRSHAEPAEL